MSDVLYVLDASALLALMLGEPGAEIVAARLPEACVGAVNLSEAIAKLAERGVPAADIQESVAELDLDIRPFGETEAMVAGLLRTGTRAAGLSLGDRACLAQAQVLGAVAVTTDRAWQEIALPVPVEVVR